MLYLYEPNVEKYYIMVSKDLMHQLHLNIKELKTVYVFKYSSNFIFNLKLLVNVNCLLIKIILFNIDELWCFIEQTVVSYVMITYFCIQYFKIKLYSSITVLSFISVVGFLVNYIYFYAFKK